MHSAFVYFKAELPHRSTVAHTNVKRELQAQWHGQRRLMKNRAGKRHNTASNNVDRSHFVENTQKNVSKDCFHSSGSSRVQLWVCYRWSDKHGKKVKPGYWYTIEYTKRNDSWIFSCILSWFLWIVGGRGWRVGHKILVIPLSNAVFAEHQEYSRMSSTTC